MFKVKRQLNNKCCFLFQAVGGLGADGQKRAKKQNGRLLQGRTWDAVREGHAYCGAGGRG